MFLLQKMCYKRVRVFDCGHQRRRTIHFCSRARVNSRGHRVACGRGIESRVAVGAWCGPRCGREYGHAGKKCVGRPIDL
ncbi:MAG: hypothetical protein QOE33_3661 [Acidobacteriota bacterium]|nr:hypothetical protein [Acidobacteriota bacterium]